MFEFARKLFQPGPLIISEVPSIIAKQRPFRLYLMRLQPHGPSGPIRISCMLPVLDTSALQSVKKMV
jgi:hypothetical protein